jgi:hypothetical protein
MPDNIHNRKVEERASQHARDRFAAIQAKSNELSLRKFYQHEIEMHQIEIRRHEEAIRKLRKLAEIDFKASENHR